MVALSRTSWSLSRPNVSPFLDDSTSRAPRAAKVTASARPSPWEAPTIHTTLHSKCRFGGSRLNRRDRSQEARTKLARTTTAAIAAAAADRIGTPKFTGSAAMATVVDRTVLVLLFALVAGALVALVAGALARASVDGPGAWRRSRKEGASSSNLSSRRMRIEVSRETRTKTRYGTNGAIDDTGILNCWGKPHWSKTHRPPSLGMTIWLVMSTRLTCCLSTSAKLEICGKAGSS